MLTQATFVRLPVPLREYYQRKADRYGLSLSDALREALYRAIDINGAKEVFQERRLDLLHTLSVSAAKPR